MKNREKPFGIPKKEDGLEIYKNKTIRYILPNNARMGVLHNYDEEYVYLLPAIIQESLYVSQKEQIKARIETEIPTRIKRVNEDIIERLSDDYLEVFVKTLNNEESQNNK